MDLHFNHLFVMTYANWTVNNLLIIPKFFFVPDIIEKRKPLAETARRAGWTGCYIEISNIPESGKIFIIKDSQQEDKSKVIDQYQRTLSSRFVITLQLRIFASSPPLATSNVVGFIVFVFILIALFYGNWLPSFTSTTSLFSYFLSMTIREMGCMLYDCFSPFFTSKE